MYTWSEYLENDFIDKKTLKIEEQEGELILYYYFDTLQWKHIYSIILRNQFLFQSVDYPHDAWDIAIDVYKIMK